MHWNTEDKWLSPCTGTQRTKGYHHALKHRGQGVITMHWTRGYYHALEQRTRGYHHALDKGLLPCTGTEDKGLLPCTGRGQGVITIHWTRGYYHALEQREQGVITMYWNTGTKGYEGGLGYDSVNLLMAIAHSTYYLLEDNSSIVFTGLAFAYYTTNNNTIDRELGVSRGNPPPLLIEVRTYR